MRITKIHQQLRKNVLHCSIFGHISFIFAGDFVRAIVIPATSCTAT